MKVNAFLVAKKSAVEQVDDLMKQVLAENKLDEDVGGNNRSGITDREIEERLARLKDLDPSMLTELVNILVPHTHYKINNYCKDLFISCTFLLEFWVKNRGCGLYTRPLV